MRIDWTCDAGRLAAIEAALPTVARHADALASGYNHPRNARLMGHVEAISPAEVVAGYAERIAEGARAFLLLSAEKLVGDADLRNLRDGAAEFAFMIGDPALQGQGLGTAFAIMIHAFGFSHLGLVRMYASIAPHNAASRRVFDKLGYVEDHSPTARGYADEPDDLVVCVERAAFERCHELALRQLRINSQ